MQGRPRLTEQQKADKPKNKVYPPVMCQHGKRKYRCAECGGIGLCEHGRQKDQCAICRTGTYFCIVTGKAKKDCRHCKDIKEIVKSIKKYDDKRRQQNMSHSSVTLKDLDHIRPISRRSAFADERLDMQYDSDLDFPFQEVSSDEDESTFVSAPGAAPGLAQGSAQGAFFLDDVPNPTVFSSHDNHDPENQGGRKRKKRITRRLRRKHNTKKKNKMIKRKVTKLSRKNKHK